MVKKPVNVLNKARNAKNDEFYTQLTDIEQELRHYKEHFKNKVVFCNCDDPFESNFFKYFAMNFNSLGLKKLIATCYSSSPVAGNELDFCVEVNGQISFVPRDNSIPEERKPRPYCIQITEVKDENGDGRIDLSDVEYLLRTGKNKLTLLQNGDFRSLECIEYLKEADIVCSNPPFSIFTDYVAQLVEYDKKFLIIGSLNAVTYKDIFPLLRDGKMWLGCRSINKDMYFHVSKKYQKYLVENKKEGSAYKIVDGEVMGRLASACWYTNLDIKKRHEEMILFKPYDPSVYQKFDNYDAINVDKVADIPCNYDGVMGVPITFIDKFNPDQFEIVGLIAGNIKGLAGIQSKTEKDGPYINGKLKYGRILIKRKVSQ